MNAERTPEIQRPRLPVEDAGELPETAHEYDRSIERIAADYRRRREERARLGQAPTPRR